MATTTNYSWTTPDDTALVKDGAAAIRSLGTAIDTTVFNNASAGIAKTIVDAKGDIIAATAADTVSRLAVGANDTVLTADSTAATGLKWATPAAGGMTLLSTTTLTGASVTIGSIPATYRDLQLVIRNYKPATDGSQLWGRFNSDTNTRYRTVQSAPSSTNLTFNITRFDFTEAADNSVDTGLMIMDIYDYANTATWKIAQSRSVTVNETTTTSLNYTSYLTFYNQTAAISDIVILTSSGNLTSGTAYLYGVK